MSVGTGGALEAIVAQAIKASGAIVRMKPEQFQKLLDRHESPLLVTAQGGFFSTHYQYLMGYRGLAFFTKSPEPLRVPSQAEVVAADKIWIPS